MLAKTVKTRAKSRCKRKDRVSPSQDRSAKRRCGRKQKTEQMKQDEDDDEPSERKRADKSGKECAPKVNEANRKVSIQEKDENSERRKVKRVDSKPSVRSTDDEFVYQTKRGKGRSVVKQSTIRLRKPKIK